MKQPTNGQKDRPSAGLREHLLPLSAGATARTLHLQMRSSERPRVCNGYLLQPYLSFGSRLPVATRNSAGCRPDSVGRVCAPRMVRRPAPVPRLPLPFTRACVPSLQSGGGNSVSMIEGPGDR